MPSIIPSYVYSIFAALIVGTIIVSTVSLSMSNIKIEAENQQLTNIDQYITAQILNIVSQMKNNQVSTEQLSLPPQIGDQIYWVNIANNSAGAWVQAGYGITVNPNQPKAYIPAHIAASGYFVSSYGRAVLECYIENQTVILTLTSE